MNILAKVLFGSKLYGTDIPSSDNDYRAIFLPELRDCLLLKVKDTWEDKTEEDLSVFSLQHYLKMCESGQSIAIEMLACPKDQVIINSPIWNYLQENRHKFFTKNMKSFLGYAKSQSSKYSARIDRLNETDNVIKYLKEFSIVDRLSSTKIWDGLPESTNAVKTVNNRNNFSDKRCYVICGREIQSSVTVEFALSVIQGIHDSYGERVRKAKDGQIEWKSLAHAFRVALQAKEIVLTGDLKFPLKDAQWLRDLRLGKFNFLEEHLDERLDNLIAEVQQLMDKSDLPDSVDKDFVESIILKSYNFEGLIKG